MSSSVDPPPEAVPVLWLNAGLSCDGESVALTGATRPSLEDLVDGVFPGVPRLELHCPLLDPRTGDDFLATFYRAAAGELPPFLLVVEGSIPDESAIDEGCWAAFGTDPESGQPISTCTWIDRLAPHAWGVVAVGTCASYAGIHAMAGNPTGCMGLPDYLGWDWTATGGNRIVCIPGCPAQPDNMTEVLLYLLRQRAGSVAPIPLDDQLRPDWLYARTAHEQCSRGGFYEQGDFADTHGKEQCIVRLGCWAPVVQCNIGKRGSNGGVGGCASVGGVCIGCTMPGFPDKFQPWLEQPPGSLLSSVAVQNYGRTITALRNFTKASLNRPPSHRRLPVLDR